MPNEPAFLTLRATEVDLAAVASIASAIRQRTGAAFVSRADALRFALSATVAGLEPVSGDSSSGPEAARQ